MWRNCQPIELQQLWEFEQAFGFRFAQPLRSFLLEYNGGSPTPGSIPTAAKTRKLDRLLNWDRGDSGSAWSKNMRLRKLIGPNRIAIGITTCDAFLCVEKQPDKKQQSLVVWNPISDEFEQCLLDMAAFVQQIG